MDREAVRLTLLAEALELSRKDRIEYYAFDELDAFFDRKKAFEFAGALKRGFLLDQPLEAIMENGFFRGYFAGLMLSSDSLSYEKKEEMARILMERFLVDLKKADDVLPGMEEFFDSAKRFEKLFFPFYKDNYRERAKMDFRDNLLMYWCFKNREYYIPIILWGNELASFLCEIADKEKFEGEWGEKLRKILPPTLAYYSIVKFAGYSVDINLPRAESITSSLFPMLVLLGNEKLTSRQLSEFIMSIAHFTTIDVLLVPVAMVAGGSDEERAKSIEIINWIYTLMDDSMLGLVLSLSSGVARNGFLYELVMSNDFANLFDRLKILLEGLSKDNLSSALAAIASALDEKEEPRDSVEKFIEYLMTLELSSGVEVSGILLSRKYGFEHEEFFKKGVNGNIYGGFDYSFLKKIARHTFSFLDELYEQMVLGYENRYRPEYIITNVEAMLVPSFLSCEDEEIEYSRAPMYTLINSVMELDDADEVFNAIVAYCKKYPYNFEFVNALMLVSAFEVDNVIKLLFDAAERAHGILSRIVVDKDEDIYLKGSEESPSNKEFVNLIDNYVDQLVTKKDYRRVLKVADTALPLLNLEDSKSLLANSLIAHWRLKDYKKLPELFEEVDDESDPKALMVMALMNYVNKEIDDAERIILNILEQFPHFIQFLLRNEEPTNEDFDKEEEIDYKHQRKIDALFLAEEFREDWFKLKGAKEWLKKVQKVFDEVNTEW